VTAGIDPPTAGRDARHVHTYQIIYITVKYVGSNAKRGDLTMTTLTPDDSTWTQGLDFPSRIFGRTGASDDFELYEEDGEFVLTVEMPGFEREEIDLAWDDGMLNVAAEHVDEERGRRRTYHRRFRFPKTVDKDDIAARYRNGVLEVRLPVAAAAAATGTPIPIEG
jgi:HSP20 family protein